MTKCDTSLDVGRQTLRRSSLMLAKSRFRTECPWLYVATYGKAIGRKCLGQSMDLSAVLDVERLIRAALIPSGGRLATIEKLTIRLPQVIRLNYFQKRKAARSSTLSLDPVHQTSLLYGR